MAKNKNKAVEDINKLLNKLNKKYKDIIMSRFGLRGRRKSTLAEIGRKYGVTRERVRQIEVAALKIMKKEAENVENIKKVYEKLLNHIKNIGGVRRHDFLEEDVKTIFHNEEFPMEYVSLVFRIFGKPEFSAESKDFYAFWYSERRVLEELRKTINKIARTFKSNKKKILEDGAYEKILKDLSKELKISESVILNMLSTSKKFAVGAFGDIGLTEWPEIMPKTVRDKAYIIIKKMKKPLHFREIAKLIDNAGFDKKKAHPQTVHNELIKDERFVLVGRGTYSLKEFGIETGTTREVIYKLLKKHGPLHKGEIMELVSQHRIVRPNTIAINLHNRKHFKRLKDGRYHIA